MESTIYPSFASHAASNVMSLDAFARMRYGEVTKFNDRWDELMYESDTRSKALFSRSIKRPQSAARTTMLLDGTLRDTIHSPPSPALGSALAPLFPDDDAPLPVEPDRVNLELDGKDFSHSAALQRFLMSVPNLRTLSLRRCIVSDDALRIVPKHCPFLNKIDLGNATGCSQFGIIALGAGCLKLSGIRLNNCNSLFETPTSAPTEPSEVTYETADAYAREHVGVGHRTSMLERIAGDVMIGHVIGTMTRGHDLVGKCAIKQKPKGFRLASDDEVKIAHSTGFSMPMLMLHALTVAPHRLQEISLSRCFDVDDDLVMSLSGQTPGLVPVEDVDELKEGADTDEAMRARKEKMDEIRKRMGLSVSDAEEAPAVATDYAAKATVKKAGFSFYKVPALDVTMHLQSLDLTACTKITDRALAFVGANCPELRMLRIALCDQPSISDAGVASVAQGCPRLTTVDLRGCATLTNASVVALAKNCFRLERLCIAGLSAVDDAALAVVASSHCSDTLVELDISRCRLITANAIKNILFKAGNLARVSTDGMINVTLTGITAQEYELLYTTFTSVRFMCKLLTETDGTKGALVPTFQPPPKEERFANQRVFAKYGSAASAAKKGKKKK